MVISNLRGPKIFGTHRSGFECLSWEAQRWEGGLRECAHRTSSLAVQPCRSLIFTAEQGHRLVPASGPQCPMLCLRDPTVRRTVTSYRGLSVLPQSRGMVAWGPMHRWSRDPASGRMVVRRPPAWVTVGPCSEEGMVAWGTLLRDQLGTP